MAARSGRVDQQRREALHPPEQRDVIHVDPPLGVDSGVRRRTTRLDVPPGAVLALFTDGLVERRGETITDGLERDDVAGLSEEMERLKKSCRRLIWLNPLLGSPGYEPICQGMRAALPYVDVFASAHNLESLRRLEEHLVRRR